MYYRLTLSQSVYDNRTNYKLGNPALALTLMTMYVYVGLVYIYTKTITRVLTHCRLRTCGRSMVARGNASYLFAK